MENIHEKTFTSKALSIFREEIELKYLRKHSIFVNTIIGVLAIPIIFTLKAFDFSTQVIFLYAFFFFALFIINLAFFAYEDYFNSLKIAMYINVLGLYIISSSLIIDTQSPSFYIGIFLVYAIVSIYQDAKATLINNIALFIVGILAISNNPNIFLLQSPNPISTVYLYVFLAVFVLLISIASSVFIKRKSKFFDKLTEIQEIEIRTLETLFELEEIHKARSLKSKHYLSSVNRFTERFTKDYDIENVFKEKLKIIKDLERLNFEEVVLKYHNHTREEINEINNLRLSKVYRIRYLAYKIGFLEDTIIPKNKIYSDTRFTSLKHYEDSRYARIIAFVVLYVLLRLDNPVYRGLNDKEVKEYLLNSELFHLIDTEVRTIYINNSEVFDKIFLEIYREEN